MRIKKEINVYSAEESKKLKVLTECSRKINERKQQTNTYDWGRRSLWFADL